MSLYAMPLVIINMGAEMLYILEQRLTAQNIDADKGAQVLTDIAAAMFQKDYIMTLFQPQEVYRVHAVRKIFERLAHTSIMRLNENRCVSEPTRTHAALTLRRGAYAKRVRAYEPDTAWHILLLVCAACVCAVWTSYMTLCSWG